MSREVKKDDEVEIHYTGKLKDDTVFDTTEGRETFKFVAGSNELLKGISEGVIGMKVGDNKTVSIDVQDAYGERSEELVTSVPLENLPENVKTGDILSSPEAQGQTWMVREIVKENATLDGNHPLAGHSLVFEISLVSIA